MAGNRRTEEYRVWEILTKDVAWSIEQLRVFGLESNSRGTELQTYQIFEILVAYLFSKLHEDYDWTVTKKGRDQGIDFVGTTNFIKSNALSIHATLTIGGQCKKRENPSELLNELGGGVIKMSAALQPAYVVIALSAKVSKNRIMNARRDIEKVTQRNCYILDREQIEGLFAAHLQHFQFLIAAALSEEDRSYVLRYFTNRSPWSVGLSTIPAERLLVRAGTYFQIKVVADYLGQPANNLSVIWHPDEASPVDAMMLISPVGLDTVQGERLAAVFEPRADSLEREINLEFISYAVGRHGGGRVIVVDGETQLAEVMLPEIVVHANKQPPFFERPYITQLRKIESSYTAAASGVPTIVAVTGGGGAGKTRLCQEVFMRVRRQRGNCISIEQANSREQPYRIFVELLLALCGPTDPHVPPVDAILRTVEKFDLPLATRLKPHLGNYVSGFGDGGLEDNQLLYSLFVLLIAARTRDYPLVIHLQNMHWCSLDAYSFLEKLVWQLGHGFDDLDHRLEARRIPVLFLFEGRVHEQRGAESKGWTTRSFELFLDRTGCERAHCGAFSDDQGRDFVRWIFEGRHTAKRQIVDALIPTQEHLLNRIHDVSGGNPFQVLEQLKLLVDQNIVRTNPSNGLAFLVQPLIATLDLPHSIQEAIQYRWRYCASNNPPLALLVQALTLVVDRLPGSLFQHLWQRIAPNVELEDIRALEIFKVDRADDVNPGSVAVLHENYFHGLRDLPFADDDRHRVCDEYLDWFVNQVAELPLALQLLEARVMHVSGKFLHSEVEKKLRAVLRASERRRARSVSAEVRGALLDWIAWPLDDAGKLGVGALIRAAGDELSYCHYLVDAGRRDIAESRAAASAERILARSEGHYSPSTGRRLQHMAMRLRCKMAYCRWNDGRPVEAARLTETLVEGAERMSTDDPVSKSVKLEVYYSHSVSLSIAGDQHRAVRFSTLAHQLALDLVDRDPLAIHAMSTHANILIAFDPQQALSVLDNCRSMAERRRVPERTRFGFSLNAGMALIVQNQFSSDTAKASSVINRAHDTLLKVYQDAHPTGWLSDAAAAALLLGICSVLKGGDAAGWFAEAAACAGQSRQLETLWRAQINLAHALDAKNETPTGSAVAVISILTNTLLSERDHGESRRFQLVAVLLAQAVRYAVIGGDPIGRETMERFPELKRLFRDQHYRELREDRSAYVSRAWIAIEGRDYALY
jgi:hypothetical protein